MTAWPPADNRLFLHQGDVMIAGDGAAITTVLGSCVAVCLYDPALRRGGMNHFVLPRAGNRPPSLRHGDAATHELIDRMLGHGSCPIRLRAKVFGGASSAGPETGSGAIRVGEHNLRVALDILKFRGIRVAAVRGGGGRGQKITFCTHSGIVTLQRLAELQLRTGCRPVPHPPARP